MVKRPRIALSGVPGTGKTTLGNLLGEHTTLEYLPETEDVILKEMGYNNINQVLDDCGVCGLIDNFFLSLNMKVEIESKKRGYVSDKSLFDMGARWFGRNWEGATREQHDRVREAMKTFADEKMYDRIIYLPLHLNREVEDDGARTTKLEVRYQRSLILRGLLVEYDVDIEPYQFDFSDSPEKVISDLKLEDFRK